MISCADRFPLPIVLRDGERVRVRGSTLLRRLRLPLTPTLSPHALGRDDGEQTAGAEARGQTGRGRFSPC